MTRRSCQEVARFLQDWLVGESGPVEAAFVAEHLEDCRECGLDAHIHLAIRFALASRGPGSLDGPTLDRLRQFVSQLHHAPGE